MTCFFCGLWMPTEDAIDAGWEPGFYTGPLDAADAWRSAPCCEACASRRLLFDADGEPYLPDPAVPPHSPMG